MPGRRLVQWCALFGVPEGTTRVALTRMVDRGELDVTGGSYRLAGRVGGRRAAQDFSLAPRLSEWAGEWRFAVVPAASRTATERSALRHAMRELRHTEVREGVWTRPDNLPRQASGVDAWKVAEAQCSWWSGRPEEDPKALAARLFEPHTWATRARSLERNVQDATAALVRHRDAALARAFVAGAAGVAHLRADPLLPPELCPRPWPGASLRETYVAYEKAFSDAVRAWFRSQ